MADVHLIGLKLSEAARKHNVLRKSLMDRLENEVKDKCSAGGKGTILSEDRVIFLRIYSIYDTVWLPINCESNYDVCLVCG